MTVFFVLKNIHTPHKLQVTKNLTYLRSYTDFRRETPLEEPGQTSEYNGLKRTKTLQKGLIEHTLSLHKALSLIPSIPPPNSIKRTPHKE